MARWNPTRVIAPVDFSEPSLNAVETAASLTASRDAVRVLHVLAEAAPHEPGVVWAAVDDKTRAIHAVQEVKRQLPEDLRDVSVTARVGSPSQEIVRFAEEQDADLIVLSSHGRTGFRRAVLGSVAEQVVRRAHCPVLVLRADGRDNK